eukprot:scaffold100326_cov51-Phaeocystis_antarctica.AAC.3
MSVTLDVSRLSGCLKAFAPQNMPNMSVTLDVSKLSGLLKFDASCGARGGRGGDHGPDRLGRGVLEKRARRIRVEIRRFETHPKHLAHVRDA